MSAVRALTPKSSGLLPVPRARLDEAWGKLADVYEFYTDPFMREICGHVAAGGSANRHEIAAVAHWVYEMRDMLRQISEQVDAIEGTTFEDLFARMEGKGDFEGSAFDANGERVSGTLNRIRDLERRLGIWQ
jgi:hypothetical protein